MKKMLLVCVVVAAVAALGFFACNAGKNNPSRNNEGIIISSTAAGQPDKVVGCGKEPEPAANRQTAEAPITKSAANKKVPAKAGSSGL